MAGNVQLENVLFFYILKRPDIIGQFKPEFFSDPTVQLLFDVATEYVERYKDEPSAAQIIELLKITGKDESITPEKVELFWRNSSSLSNYSNEWLYAEAIRFGKWHTFYKTMCEAVNYVKSVEPTINSDNIDAIINRTYNMLSHGLSFTDNSQDCGMDFFDMNNHKLEKLETRTTGYKFIDLCLNGGFSNKSLIVLMGGPKTGKSQWLCNLAAKSVLSGYNSIYITLEMSYQKVNRRIGSNIFGIPMSEYENVLANPADFKERVKSSIGGRLMPLGKLFVKEFPTSSATAKDIETAILQKEKELSTDDKPFKFKNVFIDYVNIMKDLKNPNSENTYQKIKSICEDVRAMAQRNDWCVVSVTQTNRNGMESSDLNMTDVSESAGLIATVDALFGIIRNVLMRAEGVYYLKALALRDSEHMGDKKKFKFNSTYLRIEEDEEENIIQDGMDIPQVYKSATANAAKKGGCFGQATNPATLGTPVYSEPMPVPKLGITEQQITGQDLFKM